MSDPNLTAPAGVELSTVDTVDAELVDPEPTDAQCVAAGLRQLADLLDANPDLPAVPYAFHNITVLPRDKAGVVAWARAAARFTGAKIDKYQSNMYAGINIDFGPKVRNSIYAPVSIAVRIERDEICERVVVDTRQVTKEVPNPDALAAVPKVTVTEVEEIVEWRCHPLLAEALPAGAS